VGGGPRSRAQRSTTLVNVNQHLDEPVPGGDQDTPEAAGTRGATYSERHGDHRTARRRACGPPANVSSQRTYIGTYGRSRPEGMIDLRSAPRSASTLDGHDGTNTGVVTWETSRTRWGASRPGGCRTPRLTLIKGGPKTITWALGGSPPTCRKTGNE